MSCSLTDAADRLSARTPPATTFGFERARIGPDNEGRHCWATRIDNTARSRVVARLADESTGERLPVSGT